MDIMKNQIKCILNGFPVVELAYFFGSCAAGRQTSQSDLDIAVAAVRPLSAPEKIEIMEALAHRFQRPIDLVDLADAPHPLLREVLVGGAAVICKNTDLLATFVLRLWYNEADIMPCYRQAQHERQEAFAHG